MYLNQLQQFIYKNVVYIIFVEIMKLQYFLLIFFSIPYSTSYTLNFKEKFITFCLFVYNSYNNLFQCSKSCGGGVRRRQVVCYNNKALMTENCDLAVRPSDTSICNEERCPGWRMSPWSEVKTIFNNKHKFYSCS